MTVITEPLWWHALVSTLLLHRTTSKGENTRSSGFSKYRPSREVGVSYLHPGECATDRLLLLLPSLLPPCVFGSWIERVRWSSVFISAAQRRHIHQPGAGGGDARGGDRVLRTQLRSLSSQWEGDILLLLKSFKIKCTLWWTFSGFSSQAGWFGIRWHFNNTTRKVWGDSSTLFSALDKHTDWIVVLLFVSLLYFHPYLCLCLFVCLHNNYRNFENRSRIQEFPR